MNTLKSIGINARELQLSKLGCGYLFVRFNRNNKKNNLRFDYN